MQHDNITTHPIWWIATILKMVLSLYLSCRSSNFKKKLFANANFGSKNGHVTKTVKMFPFQVKQAWAN